MCEYYERDGGYFLLRSNELWTSEQEEFIFLFTCPRLTEAVHEAVKEFVCREGKKMAHIDRAICTQEFPLSSSVMMLMKQQKRH